MKNKKFTKLIYKNLDGKLSDKELAILKHKLDNSDLLKEELMDILDLREKIGKSGVHSFKPLFEERLLDKLSAGLKPDIVFNETISGLVVSFRRIAIAAAIVLTILITYNLKSGNYYSFQNLFGVSQNTIELAFDPVQNILGEIK